jgi:hypothetical protein
VQKGLQQLLRQPDENGLSKLIMEMILSGSVESAAQDGNDALTTTAKRHRVDGAKVRTGVAAEFVANQAKNLRYILVKPHPAGLETYRWLTMSAILWPVSAILKQKSRSHEDRFAIMFPEEVCLF